MDMLDLCFLYIMLAIIIILAALIVAKIEASQSQLPVTNNIIQFNQAA